jgi:hypothetical protein
VLSYTLPPFLSPQAAPQSGLSKLAKAVQLAMDAAAAEQEEEEQLPVVNEVQEEEQLMDMLNADTVQVCMIQSLVNQQRMP